MDEIEPGAILSPDDATQLDQVRRLLTLGIAGAAVGGVMQTAGAILIGDATWAWAAALLWLVAASNMVISRRFLHRETIVSSILLMSVGSCAAIAGMALLQPSLAVVMATSAVIPIAIALPFLTTRALRHLLIVAAATILVASVASLQTDDQLQSAVDLAPARVASLVLVLGVLILVLYWSSERMKASNREFSRLFGLSSDLAETSDPTELAEVVARHLAVAMKFDDCVIYAPEAESGQMVSIGSYPVERALETASESMDQRPLVHRVISARTHAVIDVVDDPGEQSEQARLHRLDREVLLMLPLVALSGPIGVAEMTASKGRRVQERELALVHTLTFEAAMAIENSRLYQQVQQRSLHDSLTGLANSGLFRDRVAHALERLARREGGFVAVLFADLDGFKAVNDRLGHAAGDRLLAIVAERLCSVVRADDTVARVGGDEFALLLEDPSSAEGATLVAERAVAAVAAPLELAGQPVAVSISIGMALRSSGAAATTVDALIGEADAAMYEAKRTGATPAAVPARRDTRIRPGQHSSLRAR